ncbi:hypothetical protein AB0H43_03115 [Hamadaea sp. NPDC050747]|uniref:hypothetical protein n=1 Tax=Hamadaea sp. NPDC050747 TaxID=3155789 RepID=UPI00340BC9DD
MNRLPRILWRVAATGGQRHYWEPASRTYTREDYARDKAESYRRQGATEVRVYRAEVTWEDVTDVKSQ